MIQIIGLGAFFATLVIGSLIANARGRLPNAEELQEQDRKRFARFRASTLSMAIAGNSRSTQAPDGARGS